MDGYEYNLPKSQGRIFRVLHRGNPNEQLILATPMRLKLARFMVVSDDVLYKTYSFVYLHPLLNQRQLEKQY